jgi:hypothetical protein
MKCFLGFRLDTAKQCPWRGQEGQALAYHALGREQDSNAALARLIAKYDIDVAYQIAEVYAYRGESDKSFEWLERAYKQRDAGLPEAKTDPLWKNLRQDRRFTELLKKIHLPLSNLELLVVAPGEALSDRSNYIDYDAPNGNRSIHVFRRIQQIRPKGAHSGTTRSPRCGFLNALLAKPFVR